MKSRTAASTVFAIALFLTLCSTANAQYWGAYPFLRGEAMSGTWSIVATLQSAPPFSFSALMTFSSDGGLLVTQQVSTAGPAGVTIFSSGQGEWIQLGHQEFAYVFAGYLSDLKGASVGTYRVRGTFKLGDAGRILSGPAKAEDFDPSGKAFFSVDGKIEGKRIDISLFPQTSPESEPE